MTKFKSIRGLLFRKVKDLPLLWRVYRYYSENKLNIKLQNINNSAQETFKVIYDKNLWNEDESKSGIGSIETNTKKIREDLFGLFVKYKINSFIDAPCGDFNWMKTINLDKIKYIGGDIVEDLINKNKALYSNENRSFINIDITRDNLPDVDLIFVRDCLVHLNDSLIFDFIRNLKKSNIKYLLTTNFPLTNYNYNITTGNWRPINLHKKPYNFPKELDILWEETSEGGDQYPDKSLFLFDISKIGLLN
jgi:hypothetical protein